MPTGCPPPGRLYRRRAASGPTASRLSALRDDRVDLLEAPPVEAVGLRVGPHLPHRLKSPRPPDGLHRLIERVAVNPRHEGHRPAVRRQKRLALIGERLLRLPPP